MKKIYILFLGIFLIVGTSFTVPFGSGNDVEIKTKIVNFYPNPATSVIYFEYTKALDKGCTIQLYNFIGRKVHEVVVTGSKTTVNLDGYYRGIYVFQLRDKSGKIIESGKFQVVK
ncbi:MAG TPA: T9SS type A sorting domain-containing protein [Chitinophagaceae bacterium]|nr:T9SS type A sorting domain-containing protein [Chitinophagaceae bacterium]MCC6634541.1 T9SS type A sorting domain-containing protein [Chitinophagaceae bacterium]HMZ45467.1 T9SS type A sorting domain-containing protein [Chitinophagaceae bacterium]HNE92651.1 T9SS type A sorting domain-containing protein [Chitinophagaceae bacterium]HNF30473.1 T9SS type A sorting domain-containing protein [Chitinophagaceae bacterium]